MRRIQLLISASFLLCSCVQEIERAPIYELGCPDRIFTAPAQAGTAVFTIYANGAWSGTVNDEWLSLPDSENTVLSGNGDGTASIAFSHNPGDTRTGTAMLSLGTRSICLTVIQRGDLTKDEGILAELKAASSSTLTFSWGEGRSTEENCSHPYWFGLYRDPELKDIVVRYRTESASSIWNKARPAFTFAGLEKNTRYWFAAIDSVTMCKSEAIEASTLDFTAVTPGQAQAVPGAVILAEDFSEIPWNGDEVNGAAGFRSADVSAFAAPSGEFPEGGLGNRSFECLLFDSGTGSLGEAVSKSRLALWGASGQDNAPANRKKNVFARAGYIKLGGYSYVSGIVTPAMSCIPEGKTAKVRLEFTASRYGTDSQHMLVSVASGEMKDHLFTATESREHQIDVRPQTGWNRYTVELDGLRFNSHIVIGPDEKRAASGNGKVQHRLFIDDLSVEIISLDDDDSLETGIEAQAVASTSSTVTVSWGEGDSGQHAYPYWFGLYEDAALTRPVVKYRSEASDAVWGGKKPAFTFAGLDAGTTYYFTASDYVNGKKSGTVELRTGDFTVIEPSQAVCAEGATILAENFSELVHGGDGVNVAAGADENGALCKQDKESLLWADGAMTGKRLEKWSALCQDGDTRNVVLARPGYVKLGGYSYAADLVSPALGCIPQDRTAKIRITFTASRYGSDSRNTIVSLVHGNAENNRFTTESRTDRRLDIDAETAWNTYSVEIDGARADSRILIGPDFDKSGKGNGKSQHRMYLRDIKAEILELSEYVEAGIDAECVNASSSTLTFRWSKPGSGDSYAAAYEFGLYSDRFHTEPVLVYNTKASEAAWSKSDPTFIFTGLEPGRTYWFVVRDADDLTCRSRTVSATTAAFEAVEPDKAQAAPGAVILAEDFSQLIYNGDGRGTYPAAGINQDGTFCDKGKESLLWSDDTMPGQRLKKWSLLCQPDDTRRVALARAGYIKLGGYSYTADLVSPEFECIPQGAKARIKVTFSAIRYGSDSQNTIVSLVKGTAEDNRFTLRSRSDIQFDLGTSSDWTVYTFEFDGAESDSRILIGPDFDKSGKGNGKSQHRMYIDNIKVEITEL